MRILLGSLCLVRILGAQAQTPTFQWAETIPNVPTPGQLASVGDASVATDGSIYVTGSVNGPRAIVGDFIVGGAYVGRYDTSGTCLWARTLGAAKVAANGNNGVFAVGSFSGTMQFGATTLTAAGFDGFVAKYDANGQPLWAKKMGGPLNDIAFSVAVDGLGRVHVGGTFRGTGTFGGSTLIATQDTTGFHATYDTNGNFQWAAIAGGFNSPQGSPVINTMACDAAGNTIMAGTFDDTGTFGSTTLTATDNDKLYLARFDASGNVTWAYAMGSDLANFPTDVRIAPSGNIYLYGAFHGYTTTFGSTTLNNADYTHSEIFLALFDANGSPQWAQLVGSNFFNDFPSSLDVDDAGNAWVAGSNSFDAQFGSITLTGAGPFLAQYGETGAALLAEHIAPNADVSHVLGANGDHFIHGSHTGAIFDQASGSNVSTALNGAYEGYLAHYDGNLDHHWMRRMGLHGAANDGAISIVTDATGNVYTAGYFITSAIICDDTLRAPLAASHMWLNKRDANGDCVWTRHFTCSEPLGLNQVSRPGSLAMNANGDLFLSGNFFGTIQIGAYELTSASGQDLFLARFDGNGICQWALREGGAGEDAGGAIAVDPDGDLLLVGGFAGSATIGGNSFNSLGQTDGFLAKYDANGNAQWSKSFGGASWDSGAGVAVDAAGNSYITGRYTTNATFDGLILSSTGDADIVLAKCDPAGNLIWLTGSTATGWKSAGAVAIGASGQVYITGQYFGDMTVCTSTLIGDPVNFRPFLSCFDTDGALLWQKDFPCPGGGSSFGLAARPAGDIVLSGTFAGSMTVGANTLTSIGGSDAWVAGFTSAGDVLWTHTISGTDFWDIAFVTDVAADADHVHLVGSLGDLNFTAFDQTGGDFTFDPGNSGSVRFTPNAWDAFVAKFGSVESTTPPFNPPGCNGTVAVAEPIAQETDLLLFPNPVDRTFTLTGEAITADARITVRDMTGREMHVPFAINANKAVLDASALLPGNYMITVRTAKGPVTTHFIKI